MTSQDDEKRAKRILDLILKKLATSQDDMDFLVEYAKKNAVKQQNAQEADYKSRGA